MGRVKKKRSKILPWGRHCEVWMGAREPMKMADELTFLGDVIGTAMEDSVPDPENPGRHLVKVALREVMNYF